MLAAEHSFLEPKLGELQPSEGIMAAKIDGKQ